MRRGAQNRYIAELDPGSKMLVTMFSNIMALIFITLFGGLVYCGLERPGVRRAFLRPPPPSQLLCLGAACSQGGRAQSTRRDARLAGGGLAAAAPCD